MIQGQFPICISRALPQPVNLETRFSPRHMRGFSLVELMISLVLVAIGLALALPSYQDMVEKRQLSRGVEQLQAFINSAQSESVKRNQRLNVTFSRSGDTNWCVGVNLGNTACNCTTDSSNDLYCHIDNVPWIFSSDQAGDFVLLKEFGGGESWLNGYSFDHERGLIETLQGNAISDRKDLLEIELHSKSQSFQVQMQVSSTGHASICSKDEDHEISSYKVCEVFEEQEEISETAD